MRAPGTLLLAWAVWLCLAVPAAAEQASDPGSAPAGRLDAGRHHTCAVLSGGSVRCWGFNREGELGYANTVTIGDNEAPAAAGPVDLGAGRTATAISAGDFHTCALLDNGSVRCWGYGANGRLGYGNEADIGDDETPAAAPPVNLGAGRTAKALTAGGAHTCALLDDDTVRCWGFGFNGALGYGNTNNVGDDEIPGAVGAVDLGGHTARTITAGDFHTCALLEDFTVRCWGYGANGQLGYASQASIGVTNTPGSVGAVDLGAGRTARAISAGGAESCAVLDNGTVRCWGFGRDGRLGYGNERDIGDDESPGSVGPVDLGAGRTATAVSVGDHAACARLDTGAMRCWGFGEDGRLGLGSMASIGDNETPGSVGPIPLGAGRTVAAITAGSRHTCARLDDGNVRCWGYGGNGRLGLCSERNIGDDELPVSVGALALGGASGSACPRAAVRPLTQYPAPQNSTSAPDARAAEARRARALRSCLSAARRHARRELKRARRLSSSRRAHALRQRRRHLRRARRHCLKLYGRTPGRVRGLRARAASEHKVVLSFDAAGTDGSRPPAARSYLVKESVHAIRSTRTFRRARTLCRGSCRFPSMESVGARLRLGVTGLRSGRTYYFAVAARDNVSHRLGHRSRAVKVRTR